MKNVRFWGTGRSMKHNPVVMNSLRVMSWCTISTECIIGPFLRTKKLLEESTEKCESTMGFNAFGY